MKVKCKYCDSLVDDTYTNCPNCGAALDTVQRFANKQPQTIEELRRWYQAMKLPPEEVTRFFIGRDMKEPRAFGIYKGEDGDFVVYKNKSDGSRAVRYQGADEAYAVNEIYQRLKEEIVNQKSHNADRRMQQAQNAERAYQSRQTKTKKKRRRSSPFTLVFVIAMVDMVSAVLIAAFSSISYRNTASVPRPAAGYYSYEGADYYRQGNDWYYYDESGDDWGHTVEEEIPEVVANDIEGQYHIDGDGHEGLPFEDTFWYHEPSTSTYSDDNGYDSYNSYDNDSYDWDDDYGWDSNDSWDSYDLDWDSDW